MKEVSLNLLEAEAFDIIKVLEQLPTGANAWPLVQKLKAQIQEQQKQPEAVQ
jgi:hypothetical protein